MSPTFNAVCEYIVVCVASVCVASVCVASVCVASVCVASMMRKRKLTLKNADAYIDPGIPDVVFLIEKCRDVCEDGEQRGVAYMRRGDPTLTLELDCSRVLSLRSQCNKRTKLLVMNIISMELHNRRADLVLLEVADAC